MSNNTSNKTECVPYHRWHSCVVFLQRGGLYASEAFCACWRIFHTGHMWMSCRWRESSCAPWDYSSCWILSNMTSTVSKTPVIQTQNVSSFSTVPSTIHTFSTSQWDHRLLTKTCRWTKELKNFFCLEQFFFFLPRPHISHRCGFSPVWTTLWRWTSPEAVKLEK